MGTLVWDGDQVNKALGPLHVILRDFLNLGKQICTVDVCAVRKSIAAETLGSIANGGIVVCDLFCHVGTAAKDAPDSRPNLLGCD